MPFKKKAKTFLFSLALVFTGLFFFLAPLSNASAEGRRIAMIIGIMGYDTAELHEPMKLFKAAGATVDVISTEAGEAVSGGGVRVPVDRVIDTVTVGDYDAFVFVGGGGAGYYFDHTGAHALARDALKAKKVVASICAASTILAKAGVLKGKQATGYYKDPIVEHGGHYSAEFVVRDGTLITAIGPNVVKEFAEAILIALQ